jgi:CTP:molybdopterin cytidylyltransferase MocA
MAEVCGVVLAAGAARRFGSPKQLAQLDGRPLLQHAVDAACAAPDLERVVLVLGAQAERVRRAVDPGRAEVVVAEGWEDGMAASLRAGLLAARDSEWVVILLGDEPLMPAAALRDVLHAARAAPPEVLAVRATWDGEPGHPVALRGSVAGRAGELSGDQGARALLRDAVVLEVECSPLGPSPDIDRPEDLERLLEDRADGTAPAGS